MERIYDAPLESSSFIPSSEKVAFPVDFRGGGTPQSYLLFKKSMVESPSTHSICPLEVLESWDPEVENVLHYLQKMKPRGNTLAIYNSTYI